MEHLLNLPSSSVIGMLEYQSKAKSENNAVLYPDPDQHSREYATLTYRQYNNAVNNLANKISKYLPSTSSKESMTCALLATGGVEYLLSQYALLKIPNVIMFPISARNSQAAVEHLLRETKTILLITTEQYLPMVNTIREKEEFQSIQVIVWEQNEFKIKEVLNSKDDECHLNFDNTDLGKNRIEILNKVVVILHRYDLLKISFYCSRLILYLFLF